MINPVKHFCEVVMTDKRYCYCCQAYHLADQMALFNTKAGKRWRCLRSIHAAKHPPEMRDSFGRQQSLMNRVESSQMAQNSLRSRHGSAAEQGLR